MMDRNLNDIKSEIDTLVLNCVDVVSEAINNNLPVTPNVEAALKVVLQYMRNLKAEVKETATPERSEEALKKIKRIEDLLRSMN